MKSTSLSTKFITALLLLAVIAYFGVQGYRYVTDPETTAIVYRYRSEQAIAVRGYVVREEQVVDCAETLLELTHAEGERIGAGDTIATVYRSAEALRATQELEALRAQKEQLEYARSAANDTETALKLDSEIRDQILSVRGLMCIPPVAEGEHGSLPYFEKVHALFVDINEKLYDNKLDILSMGMSGDYEDAVRAGATMVRVGTAIFGARSYAI